MHANCRANQEGHQNMFSTRDFFEPCPHGTYNPATGGGLMCLPCPGGSSCLGKATATACTATQYSLEGEIHCHECPIGAKCTTAASFTMCNSGEYSGYGETVCTTCPAGSYCPDILQDALKCPPGTYQDIAGSVGCKVCAIGTYSDRYGAVTCTS